jgi:hypothetical protein
MTERIVSALLLPSASTDFGALLHCSEHSSVLDLLQNKDYMLVVLEKFEIK